MKRLRIALKSCCVDEMDLCAARSRTAWFRASAEVSTVRAGFVVAGSGCACRMALIVCAG
jgi:hypothetical protein